jgi:hypothetical protein
MDGAAGVIAMDASAAAVTVNVVDPLTVPEVALIVAVPCARLVAKPAVAALLLIVATAGVSELHCTVPVIFWVVPSLNVPVAVNCWVVPRGTAGIAGVTAIETNAALVTVIVVEPVIEPKLAVIVAVPTPVPVAKPLVVMLATDVRDEFHVTVVDKSSVLPSL